MAENHPLPLDAAALDLLEHENSERRLSWREVLPLIAQARAALALQAECERLQHDATFGTAAIVDAYKHETDALLAHVEALREWAHFGAMAFEAFWADGEPGDLDAGELQEWAVMVGLLRRRTADDAERLCADGCDWESGNGNLPLDECSCLFPTRRPLRPEEVLASTPAQSLAALRASVRAEALREAADVCDERARMFKSAIERDTIGRSDIMSACLCADMGAANQLSTAILSLAAQEGASDA